jgi:hypothetical protein
MVKTMFSPARLLLVWSFIVIATHLAGSAGTPHGASSTKFLFGTSMHRHAPYFLSYIQLFNFLVSHILNYFLHSSSFT